MTMQNATIFTSALFMLTALLAGCGSNSPVPAPSPGPAETPSKQPAVQWIEEGVEHQGRTISLGYRLPTADAEREIEPVAAITQEGKPAADAMVFSKLVSVDGEAADGKEAATLYEAASGKAPAIYGQGKLKLPAAANRCVVRFRIVLPDSDQDWERELEIPLK